MNIQIVTTGGSQPKAEVPVPHWVKQIIRTKCNGCHDDFYNYRENCGGTNWCWSIKKTYTRLKGKPSCYH